MFHFKYPNFTFHLYNPQANQLTSLFWKILIANLLHLKPLRFQASEFLQEKMQTDKIPAKILSSQQIECQQK